MAKRAYIDGLRFVLVLTVVMIHMNGVGAIGLTAADGSPALSGYPVYSNLNNICSCLLPMMALPGLFAISGYLFFANMPEWDNAVYMGKMRRRIRTLLIPFIVWNLMKFMVVALMAFHNGGFEGIVAAIDDNGGWRIFWDGASPIDNPLMMVSWYLRDLMIMAVLAPLLYILIRRLSVVVWLMLAVCDITGFWPTDNVCNAYYLSFFVLGATLSIRHINISLGKRWNMLFLPLAIGGMIACNALQSDTLRYTTVLLMLASLYVNREMFGKISASVTSASTLIYLGHGFYTLSAFTFVVNAIITQNSDVCMCIRYIIIPTAAVSFLIGAHYIMQQRCPKVLSALTGGR